MKITAATKNSNSRDNSSSKMYNPSSRKRSRGLMASRSLGHKGILGVCCHWPGAQHVKASERAHEDTSPAKSDVTSKSPVGDISVVTLIGTDTTRA